MKVWVVNQYALPPDQPGGTRHYSLARRLRDRGIDVEIVASTRNYLSGDRGGRGRRVYDGVPFTFLAPRSLPFTRGKLRRLTAMFEFGLAFRRYARSASPPDLIIGSSPSLPAASTAAAAARRLGVPFVLEIRDVWPQTLIDIGGYSPRHPGVLFFGHLERRLYRAADRIVTLLPYTQTHVERRGGAGTPVTWIPNGIDLEIVDRSLSEARSPDEEDRPFVVTYAGAHGVANALDAVLDAAALLDGSADRPVRFRLIGDGPEKERLRKRVEAEGIPNVEFRPSVPKNEVYPLLAASDALILNMTDQNLYRFGISFNKLYDYLAVARPIVFGTEAANDPVAESGAGLSVPANDAEALASAVRKLVAMPEVERRELGEKGRSFVRANHDMDMLADRLTEALTATRAGAREP